jgi:hypothetical protein
MKQDLFDKQLTNGISLFQFFSKITIGILSE